MKRSLSICIMALAVAGGPGHAHANAIALSQLSFDGLSFSLATGTFQGLSSRPDSAFAHAGLNSQFDSGALPSTWVKTTISTMLNSSLSVFKDASGLDAQAEIVSTLQLNGSPVLFREQLPAIGPNDSQSLDSIAPLSGSAVLEFGTVYQPYIEANAEREVLNAPVPDGANTAMILGAGLLGLAWFRRKPMRQNVGTSA